MSKQKISKRNRDLLTTGRTSPSAINDGPLNPEKDKTIEEFKEGTSNLKKHLEELEIKLESGWFSEF